MQRLRQFTYFEPITLQEAIEILTEKGHGTCLLAGGTDLLVRMKKGEIAPASIVNLKRLKGLDQIRQEAEKDTRIGALASLAAIESSPIIPVESFRARPGCRPTRSLRILISVVLLCGRSRNNRGY